MSLIRFNNTLEISTSAKGDIDIKTDRGVTYKTSIVNGNAARTEWWNKQNKSNLRELQKDVFLGETNRIFTRMNWTNEMTYYLVYEPRKGFAQSHDIVFARIPNKNLWLIGTNNYSWLHNSAKPNFILDIQDAVLGDITELENRNKFYKTVIEPLENYVRRQEQASNA